MPSQAPTLSICVPTYNRGALLRECLETVAAAVKPHLDRVEILVSDNASTDDTPSVVAAMQDTIPIRYSRNPENIGAEANFHAAARTASGEFIWLFSDDDKMTPEAVGAMLVGIDADYDLLITDSSVWSNDFLTLVKPALHNLNGDREFSDRQHLLRFFGTSIGYVSCVVIRRPLLLALPYDEYEAFASHGFSFLLAVYAGLPAHCRILYLHKPLVLYRGSSSIPSDSWDRVFIVGADTVLDALVSKGYSRDAIATAKGRQIVRYVIPSLVARKLHRGSLANTACLLFHHYRRVPQFWLLCFPLLLSPRFLVSMAHSNVLRLRSRGRRADSIHNFVPKGER